MTESRLTLDEVPYNEDVTITFSAVNCVAESEKVNISFVLSKHFLHAPIANNLEALLLYTLILLQVAAIQLFLHLSMEYCTTGQRYLMA